jgi:hypothetical protein
MADLVFLTIIIICIATSCALVVGCQRLMEE